VRWAEGVGSVGKAEGNKKMPKGWDFINLGDLCKFSQGIQVPVNNQYDKPKKGFVRFLRIIDFTQGNDPLRYIENPGEQYIVKKDDIAMVRYGTVGFVCTGIEGAVANNLFRITPKLPVNNNYLIYFFKSDIFTKKLVTKGATMQALSFGLIKPIKVPIPPVQEQKRIVAEIEKQFSRLDEAVDNLKRVKANLKRYKASVLKAAVEGKLTEDWRKVNADKLEPASVLIEKLKIEKKKQYKEACEKAKKEGKTKPKRAKKLPPIDKSQLHLLPESWEWVRIGDISIKIHYGYTASSDKKRVGPKMLRITDIQNNSVNWGKVPYCRIDESDKGRYLLKEGDLVFARTGATVGKSFLIKGQIPESVFASYLIRIILPSNFNNLYLYQFFQSALYRKQITEGQVGIGQPNVNGSKLSELFFPCPSYEEQNLIAQEIESRLSIADNLMKEVEAQFKKADSLRQSILKKAFEGKLVPQNTSNEPVGELLKR
jgi:type I restriction enzyme S subunit